LILYIIISHRRQRPVKKWLVMVLFLGALIFAGLSLYYWWPKSNSTGSSAGGACGNSICEPDGGENKENCPKDCSGGGN
jgi:hypothetical protein